MLQISIEREQKLKQAFEILETGEYPNATKAAVAFGIVTDFYGEDGARLDWARVG